jgi:hypothetical protein
MDAVEDAHLNDPVADAHSRVPIPEGGRPFRRCSAAETGPFADPMDTHGAIAFQRGVVVCCSLMRSIP